MTLYAGGDVKAAKSEGRWIVSMFDRRINMSGWSVNPHLGSGIAAGQVRALTNDDNTSPRAIST
jgi:hypothetical protein